AAAPRAAARNRSRAPRSTAPGFAPRGRSFSRPAAQLCVQTTARPWAHDGRNRAVGGRPVRKRAEVSPRRAGGRCGVLLVAFGLLAAACSGPGLRDQDVVVTTNPWNGYKVYLSSPTHTDSGHRGECGWEENANGNHWNSNAAVNDVHPSSSYDL